MPTSDLLFTDPPTISSAPQVHACFSFMDAIPVILEFRVNDRFVFCGDNCVHPDYLAQQAIAHRTWG